MKVLVFGASGMIGSAMFRVISATPGWEVWGTLRSAAAKRFFSSDQQDKLVRDVCARETGCGGQLHWLDQAPQGGGQIPNYGVNWACTMDVGVRIANWLMAHDLFVASGARFDDEFELVFLQSVYQHGQHIINNLEWHAELRNNHYLGDIVGLLFVAAYLPCSSETDAWLAFAVQELVVEVKEQFYEDGENFEASTSYHRLSTGIFELGDEAQATCLTLGESLFVGAYRCTDAKIFRQVQIDDGAVTVSDWVTDSQFVLRRLDPSAYAPETTIYSDGYGRLVMPAKRVI